MKSDYKVNANSEEVKRREKAIQEIIDTMTDEDIYLAKRDYARTFWHLLNTATIDFKPESKGEENK